MAAIVYQTDKRSGITYAYESHSYWDKEKKQSRAKRTLIGRVDKTTGEIVPTDGRGKKRGKKAAEEKGSDKALPCTEVSRRFCGATALLDAIGKKLGLHDDLKHCFPKTYQQMLSIVYYLILEEHKALFRFEKWHLLHKHPFGKHLSSQRISELFASIDETAKEQFFTRWGRHKADKEFWAYDTTSISSYSQTLAQVQYGYNKEHDPLAQINLALVFGSQSNLPFHYRKLAGNIPDAATLKHLLKDLERLGFGKVKLVMDRGFYSEANINALFHDHRKFLIAAKMSLGFIRKALDPLYASFRSFEYYIAQYELYAHTLTVDWDYRHERPYKGDTLEETRRLYVHYYYDIERAAEEEKTFDNKLSTLRQELLSNKRVKAHEALYEKYFDIKETPKRGIHIQVKEEVVAKTKRYYGFFVLLSNEKMDAVTALQIYRNKDVVEKAFGNLKERLNLRRVLVSSQRSLDGKLFVAFIALIYLSYIKKQMQEKELFKTYTIGTLLDTLDVIECFEAPGSKMRVGEMLKKQKEIYADLGVEPPVGSL